MKFPYGISDFKKIITQGYFYCDRTHLIAELEKGDYLLFIRPRRFGKSLLLDSNLSMDANKLKYISQIPEGNQSLLNLMREDTRSS